MSPIPPMDSRREYICAVISRKSKGAEIRPVLRIEAEKSRHFMPLASPTMTAPSTPIPAASVGVNRPNQIPPKISSIIRITPVAPILARASAFSTTASCSCVLPNKCGFSRAKTSKNRKNSDARSRPGTTPAIKSLPMDCSAITPQMISSTLGGSSIPRDALPAMQPSATPLSYFARAISG